MNEEILKLAKKCGYWSGHTIEMNDVGIEDFYRAAYNKGVEDAARVAYGTGDEQMEQKIRALEMK